MLLVDIKVIELFATKVESEHVEKPISANVNLNQRTNKWFSIYPSYPHSNYPYRYPNYPCQIFFNLFDQTKHYLIISSWLVDIIQFYIFIVYLYFW